MGCMPDYDKEIGIMDEIDIMVQPKEEPEETVNAERAMDIIGTVLLVCLILVFGFGLAFEENIFDKFLSFFGALFCCYMIYKFNPWRDKL